MKRFAVIAAFAVALFSSIGVAEAPLTITSCDITCYNQLKAAVAACGKNKPCIHAALQAFYVCEQGCGR